MNLISLEFKRVIKSKIFLGVLLFNIIFYFYVNYNMNNIYSKIAISICTLFVLPAKISELDLKYMSRLGLAYSF